MVVVVVVVVVVVAVLRMGVSLRARGRLRGNSSWKRTTGGRRGCTLGIKATAHLNRDDEHEGGRKGFNQTGRVEGVESGEGAVEYFENGKRRSWECVVQRGRGRLPPIFDYALPAQKEKLPLEGP